jgi:hypothetical protein
VICAPVSLPSSVLLAATKSTELNPVGKLARRQCTRLAKARTELGCMLLKVVRGRPMAISPRTGRCPSARLALLSFTGTTDELI